MQGDQVVVHLLNDVSSTGRVQNVAGESLYLRREVLLLHDATPAYQLPIGSGRSWVFS